MQDTKIFLQIEYGNTSTSFEKYSEMPTLPSFSKPQEVIIKDGAEGIMGYKKHLKQRKNIVFIHINQVIE